MNGAQYPTTVPVEHVFAFRVADTIDYFPGDMLYVYVRFGFDFPGNNGLSGGHQGLTSYFGIRVKGDDFVKYGIGNLVCHFVGVTFRYRFRCK